MGTEDLESTLGVESNKGAVSRLLRRRYPRIIRSVVVAGLAFSSPLLKMTEVLASGLPAAQSYAVNQLKGHVSVHNILKDIRGSKKLDKSFVEKYFYGEFPKFNLLNDEQAIIFIREISKKIASGVEHHRLLPYFLGANIQKYLSESDIVFGLLQHWSKTNKKYMIDFAGESLSVLSSNKIYGSLYIDIAEFVAQRTTREEFNKVIRFTSFTDLPKEVRKVLGPILQKYFPQKPITQGLFNSVMSNKGVVATKFKSIFKGIYFKSDRRKWVAFYADYIYGKMLSSDTSFMVSDLIENKSLWYIEGDK